MMAGSLKRYRFRRRVPALLALWLLVWTLPGCGSRTAHPQPVLLISIDGLRWDALAGAQTPNFDLLAIGGVRAKALIPAFPTKTFPNHFTIVTGLFPENHGIIHNDIYDPVMNDTFNLADREAVADSRWYEGEPIWVTAEKQGLTTATMFWPGSEAEIMGERPTFWMPYDHNMTHPDRVAQIISWVQLPADQRPVFLTMYFHIVDTQTHRYGPGSPEAIAAIQKVDSTLGDLLTGLAQVGSLDELNIILVSDHGMAAIDSNQVIFLDDYIEPEMGRVVFWSPIIGLRPREESIDYVYNILKSAHPQLQVYRREEIPARLHYSNHHRIPPIIGLADEGWSISIHEYYDRRPANFQGGTHGYDNRYESMGGIFIAKGPAFHSGLAVDSFENIHIYHLLAMVLDLDPAPNDGDPDQVREFLVR